ncbi:MAG: hypothetical protein PHS19_04905 [Eubacteriales bacterium]|nr:hypothetical protein [Eubacteriales bacterium]
MIESKIIKCGYTAREALLLLLRTDKNINLQNIEEVYYPYIRLRYLVTVGSGKRMEKLNKFSDCIIDRVSSSVYEAKGEPEFEEVKIRKEDALDIMIPLHKCYDIGHDFTLKQYIGKAKLMFTPQMQIIEEDLFYKKFYVVGCMDENGQMYYILVDGVDGGLSILDNEMHQEVIEHEEPKLLKE